MVYTPKTYPYVYDNVICQGWQIGFLKRANL